MLTLFVKLQRVSEKLTHHCICKISGTSAPAPFHVTNLQIDTFCQSTLPNRRFACFKFHCINAKSNGRLQKPKLKMNQRSVRVQLIDAHKKSGSWARIVSDYLTAVQRIRELEVRNAQLEKEAGELRVENDSLLSRAEQSQKVLALAGEAEAAQVLAKRLQNDLIIAYKERAEAAEGRASALDQLEVVREINMKQTEEVRASQHQVSTLRNEISGLRTEIQRLSASIDVSAREVESRSEENAQLQLRIAGLETENGDLVNRLIQLKDSELHRMDAASKMCEDIITSAKKQAGEILAAARMEAAKTSVSPVKGQQQVRPQHGLEAVTLTVPSVLIASTPSAHQGGCYGMAYDQTGSLLATCGVDKTVRLWDGVRGGSIAQLRGAHEAVNDVCFTADGKILLGAEDKSAIRLWDVRSRRLLNRALTGHLDKVTGIATSSHTDTNVAYSCAADRMIKVWKLSTGTCERSFKYFSKARRISIVVESGLLVSGHMDGNLRFWDPRSNGFEPVRQVTVHSGREASGVSTPMAGAPSLVASCGKDNTVCVIDVRTFNLLHTLSGPRFKVDCSPWNRPAFAPTASYVSCGSEDGTLHVWDLSEESHLISVLSIPKALLGRHPSDKTPAMVGCAWSPMGSPLVASERGGGVMFWDAAAT